MRHGDVRGQYGAARKDMKARVEPGEGAAPLTGDDDIGWIDGASEFETCAKNIQ